MLSLSRVGNVAVVTFLQKQARFTPEFIKEFNTILDDVQKDNSYTSLVTRPVPGGSTYHSGFDVKMIMGGALKDPINELVEPTSALFRRIMFFPIPTVAAVSGHMIAGGFFLALAHDTIVTSTNQKAIMTMPEVNLRLPLGPFIASLVRQRVPQPLLRRLLCGLPTTPAELVAYGIATSAGAEGDAAVEFAVNFAANMGAAFEKGPGGVEMARDTLGKIKQEVYGVGISTEPYGMLPEFLRGPSL